jgi:hypothetical protein
VRLKNLFRGRALLKAGSLGMSHLDKNVAFRQQVALADEAWWSYVTSVISPKSIYRFSDAVKGEIFRCETVVSFMVLDQQGKGEMLCRGYHRIWGLGIN